VHTARILFRKARCMRRSPAPFFVATLVAAALTACAPQPIKPSAPSPVVAAQPSAPTPPVAPAPAVPAPAAPTVRYQPVEWRAVEGWAGDDLQAAWSAFVTGCGALKARPDWKDVCERALAAPAGDGAATRQFFETQFDPWRIAYDDERGAPTETGLITGYYEPLLKGARQRGGAFRTPLLGVPDDLLSVELADVLPQLKGERVRGRLQGRRIVPYYERAALGSSASLKGHELVWVDDPVDAFFLEVQGSGRVQLPDGSVIRVAYADQNGQPYKAIGRYLVQKRELTVEQATAQGLRAWLAAHPQRLREVLNANPSVVFFREETLADAAQGPKGALGVPLTAGRSVAVDPRNLPLGAPLFLATTEPGSESPLQRLVMAQDTGGAIRGVVRADLFFGLGHDAGERAGAMRQQGRLWLLWPKGRPLPPPGPGVAPATGSTTTVELQALLDALARMTGRRFFVAQQAPAQLRGGSFDSASVGYPQLLGLLRNNALAAVTIEGVVNIVPEGQVRSYALPVVTQDDATIADDEWVTRTIPLRTETADSLVRSLRPMVAMNGFLSAAPGNRALVVVDHYANTRRLLEMVRSIDK
jgi:membrane-bound lytic murein transglycosylase A